jgi:hypothetical protein
VSDQTERVFQALAKAPDSAPFDPSCPKVEGNRNTWVGQRVWTLAHCWGFSREDIRKRLRLETKFWGEDLWSDIEHAIDTALGVLEKGNGNGKHSCHKKPVWPLRDGEKIRAILREIGPFRRENLIAISPVESLSLSPAIVLPRLYPPGSLVCCGKLEQYGPNKEKEWWQAEIKSVEEWVRYPQTLAKLGYIVPSTMLKRCLRNKKTGELLRDRGGNPSVRRLSNTGTRRYLVVEFDLGCPDEQAAIIRYLMNFASLAMVVSSAGKSLHSWWVCVGEEDRNIGSFFRYACKLGADWHKWDVSSFVRLPGGWRDQWKKDGSQIRGRQEILYFAPEVLP